MPRALLRPEDATTEGSRLLRVALRRQSIGAIARLVRCDESTVRHYAHERRKPDRMMRDVLLERLGIRAEAWDEAPSSDVYAGSAPRTAPAPAVRQR